VLQVIVPTYLRDPRGWEPGKMPHEGLRGTPDDRVGSTSA